MAFTRQSMSLNEFYCSRQIYILY